MRTNPEALPSAGKKASGEAWFTAFQNKEHTSSMTGTQFSPPKSQGYILPQFSTHTAGQFDFCSLGRKAYLQRSNGIGVKERETFIPIFKECILCSGKMFEADVQCMFGGPSVRLLWEK